MGHTKLNDLNDFVLLGKIIWDILVLRLMQIDSSTIDGNVEWVHSQYSCILTSQLSIQFLCPTKLLKIVIIL